MHNELEAVEAYLRNFNSYGPDKVVVPKSLAKLGVDPSLYIVNKLIPRSHK